MSKSLKAVGYFNNGVNCSQSVLAAFSPELGISEDDSLRIACAFGGGIGKQQLICGAVTGALMALGLKYGKALNDSEEKKKETYALSRSFCEQFKERFGSLNCLELLQNLDMNDPADSARIHELGLHDSHCTNYVKHSSNLLEVLLNKS